MNQEKKQDLTVTVFEALSSEVTAEDTRIDLLFERLRMAGITVRRLTAFDDPAAFERLQEKQVALPAVFVGNDLKCAGRYPTNEEWLSYIDYDEIPERVCRAGCHAQKK